MKNPVLFILFQLLMLESLEVMKIKKPTIFSCQSIGVPGSNEDSEADNFHLGSFTCQSIEAVYQKPIIFILCLSL